MARSKTLAEYRAGSSGAPTPERIAHERRRMGLDRPKPSRPRTDPTAPNPAAPGPPIAADVYAAAYEQARADLAAEAKPAKAKAKKRGKRRGANTGRKLGQAVTAPTVSATRAAAFTGARVAGTMLSVTALYLVLTNAETVAKVLDGVTKGLTWLSSPAKSIPYKRDDG